MILKNWMIINASDTSVSGLFIFHKRENRKKFITKYKQLVVNYAIENLIK
ncbi:hypothetical protein IGJ18_002831 [Enterococcus sp. AZ078]